MTEMKRLECLQSLIEHYLAIIGRCSKDNTVKAKIATKMYNSLMTEKQLLLLRMGREAKIDET